MKALVVHTSLNACGGGERVALATIETLKMLEFSVTLGTVEPTDWSRVKRLLKPRYLPDREVSLLRFKVRAFGIYMRLASVVVVTWERRGHSISINTHGDVLPIPCDVTYMHFPTFTLAKLAPENQKYVTSTFWKLYFIPYERIQSAIVSTLESTLLLTNSRFSASVIRRFTGFKALVIHPPVDVETFSIAGTVPPEDREDIVVTIGRYNPEKRYEFILKVAKHLPDIKFVIAGSVGEALAMRYFEKLRRMREKMSIRNVELLRDVSLPDLLNILSRSKVYLHAMVNEHFGMSVVEAMAAGLVPVVHRSGGTYTDVIEMSRYGYAYRSLEECVKAIQHALSSYRRWYTTVKRRAMSFSKHRFIEKFSTVISKVVGYGASVRLR